MCKAWRAVSDRWLLSAKPSGFMGDETEAIWEPEDSRSGRGPFHV